MLPEIEKRKEKLPEKGPIKKMILVSKDYVHYLRRYSKAVGEGKDLDCIAKPADANPRDGPKCPQLLSSLKDDLRCATNIFMEDFIGSGGVECLLEVLRACQARQNDPKAAKGRQQQTVLRKISSTQYDCLLCLKYAMQNPKSVVRVTDDAHGLSSICSCFMSTYPKSRILALQILVRVLELSSRGHALILEALTAIRVLFGEPVRFKFLIGLLQGCVSSPPAFQTETLKFLNVLLKTSPRPANRIRLQCELEEAGLDIDALETELRTRCVPCTDSVWSEIQVWRRSFLDMERVTGGKQNLETENERLQKEVQLLRQALQKLEEDKINLMQIEMELKEKCEDLNEEVTTLKTEMKSPKAVSELNQLNILDIKSHFADDDDDPFLSGDSGQLGTEEIFIDVPTIRPPVGFRSDNSSCEDNARYSPDLSSTHSSGSRSDDAKKKKNCFQTNSSSTTTTSTGFGSKASNSSDKDSALSESESDSGLNWSYPDIPGPLPDARVGRAASRTSAEGGTTIVPLRYPVLKKAAHRSRSEDRRESSSEVVRVRKQQQHLEGETKVVDSSNFFLVRRSPLEGSSPAGGDGPKVVVASGYANGKQTIVVPSYQLPAAYRNNFLARGHSTCDLYSGGVSSVKIESGGGSPPIPPPDYSCGVSVANSGGTISAMVHREITKAVKQISGWI